MSTPAIFPSLQRGVTLAGTQKIEDGTIRDKMEMGQVMTRQRFSRLRRTWKAQYDYLNATDLAALDTFYRLIVQGGALPFYWPNLLANGGFEYNTLGPAPGTNVESVVCDGWSRQVPGVSDVGDVELLSGSAHTGNNALQLSGALNASLGTQLSNTRVFSAPFAVSPGQSVQVAGWLNVAQPQALPAGVTYLVRLGLQVQNAAGGSLGEFYPPDQSQPTANGWTFVSDVVVMPAQAASAYVECVLFLGNTTGAALQLPSSSYLLAQFDDLGAALINTNPAYGVMPSLGSIPVPVRFAKPITVADAGWVNNGPTFRVECELEEV